MANLKDAVVSGVIGAIIGFAISFLMNFFVVPFPTSVFMNGLNNGISGLISGAKMSGLKVGLDEVLEIAVPLSALNALPDETLRFYIEMQSEGNPPERVPEHGEISSTIPPADYESVMWQV